MLARIAAVSLALLVAAPASAQLAGAEAFDAGVHAWDEGRFDDALPHFIAAYEQSGNPSVLLNVAAAQTELGRLAEAVGTYRRMLASEDPRALRHASLARGALAELEPRLAHLTVSVEGVAAGDVVLLDAREIGLGEPVELDAGEHRVSVRRAERALVDEAVSLAEGERRAVSLRVEPPMATAVTVSASEPPPPMIRAPVRPLVEEPWLWGVVGSAAAVIVAVIIGVAVALSASPATYAGSFEPGQVWVR